VPDDTGIFYPSVYIHKTASGFVHEDSFSNVAVIYFKGIFIPSMISVIPNPFLVNEKKIICLCISNEKSWTLTRYYFWIILDRHGTEKRRACQSENIISV
jgi:hypothetical protein